MQGWALCFVYLYVFLGLFNWVTGLHWLGEFSLPFSILGGLGLAIASNANPSTIPAAPTTRDTPEETATPTESKEDNIMAGQSAPPSSASSPVADPSISFVINKNARPQ